jgi:predicted DNA-binding protein (UPF0251 family)
MATKTLPITAVSFEKVFLRNAFNGTTCHREHRNADEYMLKTAKWHQGLVDWREIACKAFEKKELGDALWRAIVSLPMKYREVLFLVDVKNLNTAETAWILNITTGAARARLLRARLQVYSALSSSLFLRTCYRILRNIYRSYRGTESEIGAIRW